MVRRTIWSALAVAGGLGAAGALAHPLDGLTPAEYQRINEILRAEGVVDDDTLYPLIELEEPPKAAVRDWEEGDSLDRKAMVQFTAGEDFREAIVNITQGDVESVETIDGQPMIMFAEFMSALEGVLGDERMIEALARRGIAPEEAFCLPLTAGNFMTARYENTRLMKVPCYKKPDGSNFYAKPIEGVFALFDVQRGEVIEVTDEEVLPVPEDDWGYTQEEVAERTELREEMNPAVVQQEGEPNYTIDGSHVEWDIWRFNYRVDKRPGLVINDLEVNDQGTWRSVIYQAHLSEVFVPYMDPSEGWYWRTYMDSGEYGFGLFLTPLTPGVDCPRYATFLPAVIADDAGNPLEIPDAICIFERNIGDAAWRHFEVFAQSPDQFVPAEGRPDTELVVRTASEVGNYDYFIDYRLKQDGQIFIKIGATGLDAVKGVAATSMNDDGAAAETEHGTLIAPHLVAANHDHYFNFRIDFDVDQPENDFTAMDLVPAELPADHPRQSMWKVEHNKPDSELDARYQVSAFEPRYYHISNPNREGYLGHTPGWMIHHGSVAYGPYDYDNDPPFMRNDYIEYSVWNTVHDPAERYAGGKYAMQSDGSDTLAEWVKADEALQGRDIVTWFSAGFHHVPRMEDWPVMSTEWKTVHIMPHNFFEYNPALTIRSNQ